MHPESAVSSDAKKQVGLTVLRAAMSRLNKVQAEKHTGLFCSSSRNMSANIKWLVCMSTILSQTNPKTHKEGKESVESLMNNVQQKLNVVWFGQVHTEMDQVSLLISDMVLSGRHFKSIFLATVATS